MSERKDLVESQHVKKAAGLALALFLTGGEAATLQAQSAQTIANRGTETTTSESKLYCNIKTLTPTERAHHKQLTDKLIAVRRATVETDKGYEFQFSPTDVSLAELADWAVAESKCCPFFDFHLELERSGTLLCLRLTGEEGIKGFIRTEFLTASK